MSAACPCTLHRIFVNGIPSVFAEREKLHSLCAAFGVVNDVWVRRIDRTTGIHESWAFIAFRDELSVDEIMQKGLVVPLSTGCLVPLQLERVLLREHVDPGDCTVTEETVRRIIHEGSTALTFEGLRQQLSRSFGRPMLGDDAKMIANALSQHRKASALAEQGRCEEKTRAVHNSSIIILSAYSSNYAPGIICERNNRLYANRHSYHFRCDVMPPDDMLAAIAPRTAFTWYKVCMLSQVLEQAESRGYRYVVWIDGDAVVVDQERPLQALINEGGDRDLIVGEDFSQTSPFNAGVMVIKAVPWCIALFQQVWDGNLSRKYYNKLYHEQSALVRLLAKQEEFPPDFKSELRGGGFTQHVCILPRGRLQSNQMVGSVRPFIFHAVCRSQLKIASLQSALKSSGHLLEEACIDSETHDDGDPQEAETCHHLHI